MTLLGRGRRQRGCGLHKAGQPTHSGSAARVVVGGQGRVGRGDRPKIVRVMPAAARAHESVLEAALV